MEKNTFETQIKCPLSNFSPDNLRGWSSIIRSRKQIIFKWLFYENLEKIRAFLTHTWSGFLTQESPFSLCWKYCSVICLLKLINFWKIKTRVMKKREPLLTKPFSRLCTDSSATHSCKFQMCTFKIKGGDTFWFRPLKYGQNLIFDTAVAKSKNFLNSFLRRAAHVLFR